MQWEDECSGGWKTLHELQSPLFVCVFTSDDEMDSLSLFWWEELFVSSNWISDLKLSEENLNSKRKSYHFVKIPRNRVGDFLNGHRNLGSQVIHPSVLASDCTALPVTWFRRVGE